MSNLVLVTGASGFIGLHLVHELFANGHDIVAVVRSEARAGEILNAASQHSDRKLFLEEVPDMGASDAYDTVFKKYQDIKYVIHLATPFTPDLEALVSNTVGGVLNLLNAARSYGPNVERFVYTSSIVAFFDYTFTTPPKKLVNEDTWLDWQPEEASESMMHAYHVAKTAAERAFWEFLESDETKFTGIALAPSVTIGPSLGPGKTFSEQGKSPQQLVNILRGKIPQDQATNFIHVKDVARAHRVALTSPYAGNRWVVALPSVVNKELVAKYGLGTPDPSVNAEEIAAITIYDFSKTNREVGFDYIPLDQGIEDTLADMRSKQAI